MPEPGAQVWGMHWEEAELSISLQSQGLIVVM